MATFRGAVHTAKGYFNLGAAFRVKIRVIGKQPKIRGASGIECSGKITFRSVTKKTAVKVDPKGRLVVGRNLFINQGSSIHVSHYIEIGNNVMIGDSVLILDTNEHLMPGESSIKVAPVTIGDNVWISSRCIILPGVKIGKGSVVGAGTVVTKDVPEACLVVGSPARIVREFSL